MTNSSVHPQPVDSLFALGQRIARYLNADVPSRAEVRQFVSALGSEVALGVFGGMVRDLARWGARSFASDVDLVADVDDEMLAQRLSRYDYERNHFGGFRVQLDRTHVDIWTVRSTWAIRQGLVRGHSFADLPRTTFFDWDGAVYDLRRRCVFALPSYLERLRSGVVDLNLAANPNSLGVLTRSLRIVALGRARLSQRLCADAVERMRLFSDEAILVQERDSYSRTVLSPQLVAAMRAALTERVRHQIDAPFQLERGQLSLPIEIATW